MALLLIFTLFSSLVLIPQKFNIRRKALNVASDTFVNGMFACSDTYDQAMTSTRYSTLLGIFFHYSYPTRKFYYSAE